jgi:phage FluMu protein Com
MDFLVALIWLFCLIGVPYLAVKRERNPVLFLLLTILIGPFAFIPLRKRKVTKTRPEASTVQDPSSDNQNVSFSFTAASDNYVEPTDARVAACPSCGSILAKIPGAKTKCPHCSTFMFIRTDPGTNSRVVVTAERAEEIEDEWAKINGTWEERQEGKRRFAATKEQLTKKFHGKVPSDNDINWSLLNEDSMKHASMQNWGLYRNVIFQMGEILYKEARYLMAIEKYLLVCYIDTCGPRNISTPLGQKSDVWGSAFSKEEAFLAPGVIERIQKAAKRIDTELDDLKADFMELGKKYKGAIPFTRSTEESWGEIIQELKKP